MSRYPRDGVPVWERFGESYREAHELGDDRHRLTLPDIPDPARLLFVCDGGGYWHERYHRPDRHVEDEPTAGENDARQWAVNVAFLDGHVRAVSFFSELWSPYTDFLAETDHDVGG